MFLPKPPGREQAEKSIKRQKEADVRGVITQQICRRWPFASAGQNQLNIDFMALNELRQPTSPPPPTWRSNGLSIRLLEFYSWAALFFCCGDPCCLPGTWATRLERGWAGDGGTDKIGSLWQVGSLRLQTVALSKKKKKEKEEKKVPLLSPNSVCTLNSATLKTIFPGSGSSGQRSYHVTFNMSGKKTWFMALKLLLHWVCCETKSCAVCIVKIRLSSEFARRYLSLNVTQVGRLRQTFVFGPL